MALVNSNRILKVAIILFASTILPTKFTNAQILIGARIGIGGVNVNDILKAFVLNGSDIEVNLEEAAGRKPVFGLDVISISESGLTIESGLSFEGLGFKKELQVKSLSNSKEITVEAKTNLFTANIGAGWNLLSIADKNLFLIPTMGIIYGRGKNPSHEDAFVAYKNNPDKTEFEAGKNNFFGFGFGLTLGGKINDLGIVLRPGYYYRFLGDGVKGWHSTITISIYHSTE